MRPFLTGCAGERSPAFVVVRRKHLRYDLAYAYIELCKTALQYGLYDHDMQRLTMIVAIRTGLSV